MSRFILTPCSISKSRILPTGEPDLELTLEEMFARFAASGTRAAKEKILRLRAGTYFGLLRANGSETPRNFTIRMDSRDDRVSWLERQSPEVVDAIDTIFEVRRVALPTRVTLESEPG